MAWMSCIVSIVLKSAGQEERVMEIVSGRRVWSGEEHRSTLHRTDSTATCCLEDTILPPTTG